MTSRLVIRFVGVQGNQNLRGWTPESPTDFAELVTLAIGFGARPGTDDFSIRVATPAGLAGLPARDGIIATRPLLVVDRYDFGELWSWLEATVQGCEAGTWPECVERLRRYFSWEYDGYDAR
jgi:hypothetical protein